MRVRERMRRRGESKRDRRVVLLGTRQSLLSLFVNLRPCDKHILLSATAEKGGGTRR
jgi:hypothetical protein